MSNMIRKIKLGWGLRKEIMDMIVPPPAPENLVDGVPENEYLKKVKCSTIEEAQAKEEIRILVWAIFVVTVSSAAIIMGIISSIGA